MAISARWKRGSLVLALLLACGAAAAAWNYDALVQWLTSAGRTATIMVSGNIEAHQSVLGFKTVQSRIIELPLNEGQWVKAGQLISRLDDSDYRQQVVMAEAALAVQRRQLAAAEQNLAAAKKTVESDAADLELAKVEFSRTTGLTRIGAASVEARDQANAVLKKANAAIERDRALEAAAERQVELAMANIRNAEESLKLAKIVLDYTVLAAPFDGVITVRQAELGEIMVPGAPVGYARRPRSHLAARLYQRNRSRQDPPRSKRRGDDRHLPGQDLSGPRFLHLVIRRVYAEERRDPRGTRHAGLPHQDRHRQSDP